jgi:hypothetical protein
MLLKIVLIATVTLGIAGIAGTPKVHNPKPTRIAAVSDCCDWPPPDCPPTCPVRR